MLEYSRSVKYTILVYYNILGVYIMYVELVTVFNILEYPKYRILL